MARRIAQAPNSYPTWLAPEAPVTLEFDVKTLTAFTNEFVEVQAPEAKLRYRVVEPANYEFRWTNLIDATGQSMTLQFSAKVSNATERTNEWSANPRGTVVLVHGYGVAGFAMLPWAFLLGQEGWRCVVVDLRGHGKSTGDRVHFGNAETRDLSLILDRLQEQGRLAEPVAAVGDSLGAVIVLRWKMEEERVTRVVSMSPYADLGRAILNIADQYAGWLPDWWIRAGIRSLPELLKVERCDLNPECWLREEGEEKGAALFVAGEKDRIAPVNEVRRLYEMAGFDRSDFVLVPNATHEGLPFMFDDLADPVVKWLNEEEGIVKRETGGENAERSTSGG